MKIFTGVLVHRVARPLRGSVSCGSGWSVPCVSIQLTLSQTRYPDTCTFSNTSLSLTAPERSPELCATLNTRRFLRSLRRRHSAYCVAFSGFPFKPEKGTMCGRTTCPCNSSAPETVEHTFHTCHRSMRIWELVLSSWGDVTGESKIKPTDGLVVLFGDRSGTRLDEAEQAQFSGLEEPFAVLHKITLPTILQERNRDAAPKAKQRRSPTVLFQKVQHVVQRVESRRWRQARRQQQFDHGDAVAAFRKRWEAPGIAVIAADEQSITIILFMRKAVRDQWHRSPKGTGHYRSQQYAPPANLPPLTISIFSDGSALTRKIGQPAPPRATAWLQLKAPALMP